MSRMTSSTVYSSGDIAVTLVPFDDGQGEKKRPILVVSSAAFNRRTDRVLYCPITTTKVPLATYHALEYSQGSLPAQSNVVTDGVFTVHQDRLTRKVGRASDAFMQKVLRDVHANIATPANR